MEAKKETSHRDEKQTGAQSLKASSKKECTKWHQSNLSFPAPPGGKGMNDYSDKTQSFKGQTSCPYHQTILQLHFNPTATPADKMQRFLNTPAAQHPLCLTNGLLIGHAESSGCTCWTISHDNLDEKTRRRILEFYADVDS